MCETVDFCDARMQVGSECDKHIFTMRATARSGPTALMNQAAVFSGCLVDKNEICKLGLPVG